MATDGGVVGGKRDGEEDGKRRGASADWISTLMWRLTYRRYIETWKLETWRVRGNFPFLLNHMLKFLVISIVLTHRSEMLSTASQYLTDLRRRTRVIISRKCTQSESR